jgi:uncharacterized protein
MSLPPRDATTPAVPVNDVDRLDVLDVMRGVALFGILLANVLVFAGVMYLSEEVRSALPHPKLDAAVRWLQVIFIEGKFYAVFSLLLGIGAAMHLGDGRDPVRVRRFRRRMLVLAAIGLAHSVLWTGDILFFYAVLGMLLPWCVRLTARQLVQGGAMLFAMAAAWQYLVFDGVRLLGLPGAWPFSLAWDHLEPHLAAMDAAQQRGDLITLMRYNLTAIWADRWTHLIATGRPFRVFGMFLLGMWTARAGIPGALERHRPLIIRVLRIALPMGLLGSVLLAVGRLRSPESVLGDVMPISESVGILGLSLAYAAMIALIWQRWRPAILRVFQPLGRMALTVYLSQTLICLVGLSELGVGWFMQIGAFAATWIALPVILLQMMFAHWWLARFRFGPAEWLWRSLTYGARQPMRRR